MKIPACFILAISSVLECFFADFSFVKKFYLHTFLDFSKICLGLQFIAYILYHLGFSEVSFRTLDKYLVFEFFGASFLIKYFLLLSVTLFLLFFSRLFEFCNSSNCFCLLSPTRKYILL